MTIRKTLRTLQFWEILSDSDDFWYVQPCSMAYWGSIIFGGRKIVLMCTMIVEARSLIISFRDHYTIQIKSHFDADFAKRAIDKSVCKLIPASGGFSIWFLNLAFWLVESAIQTSILKPFKSRIEIWKLEKMFKTKETDCSIERIIRTCERQSLPSDNDWWRKSNILYCFWKW